MTELSAALDALYARRQDVGRFIARDGRAGAVTVDGSGADAYTGPVVVIVDHRSGSAAEIFAAVVQGSGRGRVVGERTAGAVLNAFPYRLPDGGRLHVSRRDFHDLCGVRLQRVGVAPRDSADVVHRELADARRRDDRAMERALAAVRDSAAIASLPPACAP
jgi:carboxyl-terminal processing protease